MTLAITHHFDNQEQFLSTKKPKVHFTREDVEDFLVLLTPIVGQLTPAELQKNNFILWLVECLQFSLQEKNARHSVQICGLLGILGAKFPEMVLPYFSISDGKRPLSLILIATLSQNEEIAASIQALFQKIFAAAPLPTVKMLIQGALGTNGFIEITRGLWGAIGVNKNQKNALFFIGMLQGFLDTSPDKFDEQLAKVIAQGRFKEKTVGYLLILSLYQAVLTKDDLVLKELVALFKRALRLPGKNQLCKDLTFRESSEKAHGLYIALMALEGATLCENSLAINAILELLKELPFTEEFVDSLTTPLTIRTIGTKKAETENGLLYLVLALKNTLDCNQFNNELYDYLFQVVSAPRMQIQSALTQSIYYENRTITTLEILFRMHSGSIPDSNEQKKIERLIHAVIETHFSDFIAPLAIGPTEVIERKGGPEFSPGARAAFGFWKEYINRPALQVSLGVNLLV
ncbi:Uncharacterised protein (plasmid) [Legionella adelaidensis]|uniref:Uncharacterized protein n=1 Tax=Legionella adelaidensis TaxID=45056 RepID=A0A0W0R1N4_9GAMM|nr:hypothetical protein [Legionella adelaidensis]KTC64873.1 hypothetical protein Lade_2167 [Legionella adelaidensis]VEH82956.1 Uncharacterised protein [Legionella adelaidensis]